MEIKELLGLTELTDKRGLLWKACAAELLGNLLLNFFGCSSCITLTGAPADLVKIALTFGLVIFVSVQALCHISGAHFNPAVTVAMLLTGKTPLLRGLLYIISQCVGAVCGSAILKAFTPEDDAIRGTLGLTQVSPKLSAIQGFGVEFLLGFILVLVVFGVCDGNRNPATISAPLAIGIAVAVGHLAALEFTGASMNPARTFGSAVIAGIWTDHWVYWLGPSLGALAAALVYQSGFAAPAPGETTYSPVQVEEKELQQLDGKNKDQVP